MRSQILVRTRGAVAVQKEAARTGLHRKTSCWQRRQRDATPAARRRLAWAPMARAASSAAMNSPPGAVPIRAPVIVYTEDMKKGRASPDRDIFRICV